MIFWVFKTQVNFKLPRDRKLYQSARFHTEMNQKFFDLFLLKIHDYDEIESGEYLIDLVIPNQRFIDFEINIGSKNNTVSGPPHCRRGNNYRQRLYRQSQS